MADKDKRENPVASPAKAPATSMSLQERFNTAVLLTPTGILNALYGAQVRTAVKDFAVNVTDTVATVVTGFNTEKGDKAADWLKKVLDKGSAPVDGQFDFRMAKGWKMPEGVKYNGLLPSDPQYKGPKVGEKIEPTLSMFYRDKQGKIEVLDKDDARFSHIMGPYALTQVGLMATVGTKGLTSLKSALAASTTHLGKVGTATYLSLASADLYGGGAQIAQKVNHSMILKPEAIDRFAHIIDKPQSLTPQQILKDVKLILEEHAKKEGRNTTPYYIEVPTSPDQAMKLLDQMSKGQVKGYARANPFAEIPAGAKKEDIHIGNIREVMDNPHFQRSFLKLAIRAVEGETFNPSERMALRFGLNILFAQKDLPLSAADNKSDLELHTQAVQALKGYLSEPVITDKFRKYFESDKSLSADQIDARVQYGVLSWIKSGRQDTASNQELVTLMHKQVGQIDAKLDAQAKEEMQKIQMQAMSMAMMP